MKQIKKLSKGQMFVFTAKFLNDNLHISRFSSYGVKGNKVSDKKVEIVILSPGSETIEIMEVEENLMIEDEYMDTRINFFKLKFFNEFFDDSKKYRKWKLYIDGVRHDA